MANCTYAAKSGNLQIFVWAKQQGYSWNFEAACGMAAKKGDLKMVKFLWEQRKRK